MRWSAEDKRKKWHRKFAWLPKEVDGEYVWLEFYWRKLVYENFWFTRWLISLEEL